jgi:hypothetical protein
MSKGPQKRRPPAQYYIRIILGLAPVKIYVLSQSLLYTLALVSHCRADVESDSPRGPDSDVVILPSASIKPCIYLDPLSTRSLHPTNMAPEVSISDASSLPTFTTPSRGDNFRVPSYPHPPFQDGDGT